MADDKQDKQDEQQDKSFGTGEPYQDPNSGAAPQPGGHSAGAVPYPEPDDSEPMDPSGPSFGSGEDPAGYGALEHQAAGPQAGYADASAVDAQPDADTDTDPGPDGDGSEGGEGEGEGGEEVPPYSEWLKSDLEQECQSRNLSTSGNKADLVARLEAYDEEHAGDES